MDFKEERERMVYEQLIPRGISDKLVISAFLNVPRHEFIPMEHWNIAYGDHPLPIGNGQTISQPYMVALMTQCLELKGGEKILEVGAGSGYQAAILSKIAGTVITIERIESLALKCEKKMKDLGYNNIKVYTGDGTLGFKDEAPYDGIIVTAASPFVPEAYIEQLKTEGKIVIPVGDRFSQVLTVLTKKDSEVDVNEVCGCVFVPLIGRDGWRE